LADEIAGLLPAEHGAGRIAPGRAMIGLVAGEEIEEQVGLAERPFLAALAALEDVAEELLRRLAVEEVLLVRRTLISVAGRHGDAVNADRHHVIEKLRHPLRIGVVE